MYIPKRYGSYKTHKCPFCSKNAVTENKQKVPVCISHQNSIIPDQKCTCGSWLELMSGKFGHYFNCIKCGNVNFKRVSIIIPKTSPVKNTTNTNIVNPKSTTSKPPKEIVIRSDDPYYFS